MAISLKDLRREKPILPPRIVIYGPEGIGKNTLASEFPSPVFLDMEDGTPADLGWEPPGWGPDTVKSFDDVMSVLMSLYTDEHDYRTLVFDSVDRMEPLVWAKVCELNKWANIEAPGYGKGYKAADYIWRDFVDGLNALRKDRGMAFVLLAHSDIDRFDDPQTQSYSRYDLRLHERANAIIKDEVDAILLIKQDASIKIEDQGFNKKRAQADGGGQRWIYTEARPAFVAKNRYGMPPKLPFTRGSGFAELAKYFPGAPAPAEEPAAQTAEPAADQAAA